MFTLNLAPLNVMALCFSRIQVLLDCPYHESFVAGVYAKCLRSYAYVYGVITTNSTLKRGRRLGYSSGQWSAYRREASLPYCFFLHAKADAVRVANVSVDADNILFVRVYLKISLPMKAANAVTVNVLHDQFVASICYEIDGSRDESILYTDPARRKIEDIQISSGINNAPSKLACVTVVLDFDCYCSS